jgi:hypothetical protein
MSHLRTYSYRPAGSLNAVLFLSLIAVVLAACGTEPLPAAGRPDFPVATFALRDVTPAPVSPTSTPWPNLVDDEVRVIPEGLDPKFYSRASSDEVVALWTQFLTGTVSNANSGRFYFRSRRSFEGNLHLCPDGTGFLVGDPEGPLKWSVNPSAGYWYEVTLSHEIPLTGDSVTYAIGVNDGNPARSGSSTPMEFRLSDRCALANAGIQYAFTDEERMLKEQVDIKQIVIDEIPWKDGKREFPSQITVEGSSEIDQNLGVDYWRAYLSGAVVSAVAYNYAQYSVTEAFSGDLHLCSESVAVLDGDLLGIGEWAVQPSGSNPYNAKIVFTLPGDPKFRTIVLGASGDSPIRMGRDADTGLIAATPLHISESNECESASDS